MAKPHCYGLPPCSKQAGKRQALLVPRIGSLARKNQLVQSDIVSRVVQ